MVRWSEAGRVGDWDKWLWTEGKMVRGKDGKIVRWVDGEMERRTVGEMQR